MANANASKTCEIAVLDSKNASAEANMNILLADNTAKREAANAYLDAVKSRFASRVEQVKSERAIDMADKQYTLAMKHTDLETRWSRHELHGKIESQAGGSAEEAGRDADGLTWSTGPRSWPRSKKAQFDYKPLPTMAASPEKDITPVTKKTTGKDDKVTTLPSVPMQSNL